MRVTQKFFQPNYKDFTAVWGTWCMGTWYMGTWYMGTWYMGTWVFSILNGFIIPDNLQCALFRNSLLVFQYNFQYKCYPFASLDPKN